MFRLSLCCRSGTTESADKTMIELKQGDILHADAEALVNTVNCVGVMGRGVALQFRNAFPENYKVYKATCDSRELRPGKLLTFDRATWENPRYIINFPTKDHWRGKSQIAYIEQGLEALVAEVKRLGIRSIALPPLGCGLGGLNWNDVKPRIETAFAPLTDVSVLLYEPAGAPAPDSMTHTAEPPPMTAGRATLLALIQRYLAGLMDTGVTLLEIQKLLYFMQEGGEPLKLRYAKGTYGPYADNVRHVLNRIEGHFILGYGDAADSPTREIELQGDAGTRGENYLLTKPDTLSRLTCVSDLICGFETPFGMELLSTVHWVVVHEGARSPEEAVSHVYEWNEHKRMFQESHLRLAYDVLEKKGWLSSENHGSQASARQE